MKKLAERHKEKNDFGSARCGTILLQMKTSLNKLGLSALSRLAKQLGAKCNPNPTGIDLINFNDVLQKDEDITIYLWDWEYGLVVITDPEGALGNVILSALTEDVTDFRTETSRFSHVCFHLRTVNILQIHRVDVIDVTSWRQEREFELGQGDYENRNIYGR